MEVTITEHDARYGHYPTPTTPWSCKATSRLTGRSRSLDQHAKELPIFEKLDIRNDRIDDPGGYVIEYASHTAIIRGDNWSAVNKEKNSYMAAEKKEARRILRAIAMYYH